MIILKVISQDHYLLCIFNPPHKCGSQCFIHPSRTTNNNFPNILIIYLFDQQILKTIFHQFNVSKVSTMKGLFYPKTYFNWLWIVS